MSTIYGYCRISTKKQSIDRQVRNINEKYEDKGVVILKEAFTGKTLDRPLWNKLFKTVKSGDTIIFDSVSRMSRNADEGVKTYFELLDRGVKLVFLKEHYIDTDTYCENTKDRIELIGTDEDEIFKGINNYFRKLAVKQIRIAFDQAQKELDNLHQGTREGIATARLEGKQIGLPKGTKLTTKKSIAMKKRIVELSRNFNGSNTDAETIKILGIDRKTYYKYKKELSQES